MSVAGLGGQVSIDLDDAAQSRLHLGVLARPNAYIELRARANGEWRKAFFESVAEAAAMAQKAKDVADVYVGVLPRTHAGYGGDALFEYGDVMWCEADNETALSRAMNFTPAAPLVVRSSPGKGHFYWFLDKLIPLDFIERGNKRLAHHLGCDPRATNAGRILRVAGTVNHKPTGGRVAITRYETTDNVSAAALVGNLPDPAPPKPLAVARTPLPPDADTESLRNIPARVYIERLTGRDVLHGMARCPFHSGGNERTPSLSVGGPAEELFLCFGCDIGGDVFRFASLLWGLDEKRDFVQIKTKLKEML
jgi:hypothetical protein